ncbi:MAG: hypothetical protein CMP11_06815 [Zetaproteobacteria bacterium]|nr:hypothetical protein [Pseudobdellovibrionaceae bacterium]|tara:strand:+ start:659 stop:1327 length:669 start_codon:yes stop_codon:yes gene_type:complete
MILIKKCVNKFYIVYNLNKKNLFLLTLVLFFAAEKRLESQNSQIDSIIKDEKTKSKRLNTQKKEQENQNSPEEINTENLSDIINIERVKNFHLKYNYSSEAKPDPFKPPTSKEGKKSIKIQITSSLQKFDIEELKLVGIWNIGKNKNKALVMTPDEEGVICKVNDPIGKKGAVIHEITDNKISIRKFKLTKEGSRIYSDEYLILGGKEEEKNKDDIIVITPE